SPCLWGCDPSVRSPCWLGWSMWLCGELPSSPPMTRRCPPSIPRRPMPPQSTQEPKLMTTPHTVPSVLFVGVKNVGKSQMAAALMRHHAQATGTRVEVHSAGTHPGASINHLAADVIAEVGADMSHETTKPIDPEVLARMDRVVVLGDEAKVEPIESMAGTIETWVTDEPSERGIDGIERMRLVRDDIDARVRGLLTEFTTTES